LSEADKGKKSIAREIVGVTPGRAERIEEKSAKLAAHQKKDLLWKGDKMVWGDNTITEGGRCCEGGGVNGAGIVGTMPLLSGLC